MPDSVDRYLAKVPQPHRRTLQALRRTLRSLLPTAVETISYGMPAFKVDGVAVAGFAAFKNHCSYFPHSGHVTGRLKKELASFETEQGTVRFPAARPLPKALLKKLIQVRLTLESEKVLKRTGVARNYYAHGVVQSKGRMKSGRMHGKWEWYRKDGSIMRSGEFAGGRQVGVWRTFDRKGKVVRETRFDS